MTAPMSDRERVDVAKVRAERDAQWIEHLHRYFEHIQPIEALRKLFARWDEDGIIAAHVHEVWKRDAKVAELMAEIERMCMKLSEGTLHDAICNGDHRKRVGAPDMICNCTLGVEIKQLRAQLATAQQERDEAAMVSGVLDKELSLVRIHHDGWKERAAQAESALAAQAEEVGRLRAWIEEHGIHSDACLTPGDVADEAIRTGNRELIRPCVCGLDAILNPPSGQFVEGEPELPRPTFPRHTFEPTLNTGLCNYYEGGDPAKASSYCALPARMHAPTPPVPEEKR